MNEYIIQSQFKITLSKQIKHGKHDIPVNTKAFR